MRIGAELDLRIGKSRPAELDLRIGKSLPAEVDLRIGKSRPAELDSRNQAQVGLRNGLLPLAEVGLSILDVTVRIGK